MTNKYKKQANAAQKSFKKFRKCERKKVFYSAESAAESCGGVSYNCGYCGFWHGSNSRNTFENKLKRRLKIE